MFGILVIDIQKWIERPKKTYLEIWIEEYEKDVPTVWSNNEV
jgi:hypothetical protein